MMQLPITIDLKTFEELIRTKLGEANAGRREGLIHMEDLDIDDIYTNKISFEATARALPRNYKFRGQTTYITLLWGPEFILMNIDRRDAKKVSYGDGFRMKVIK